DLVSRANFAFLEDAKIEPRPSATGQQCRHPRFVHSNADAIAGHARLRHLEHGAADPKTVANAHRVVGHSFDREVLSELSVDEMDLSERPLQITVRFDLVYETRAMLAAMPGKVALAVSVEIQAAGPAAPPHRILPDRGVYGAALPLDVARQSDINRQQ